MENRINDQDRVPSLIILLLIVQRERERAEDWSLTLNVLQSALMTSGEKTRLSVTLVFPRNKQLVTIAIRFQINQASNYNAPVTCILDLVALLTKYFFFYFFYSYFFCDQHVFFCVCGTVEAKGTSG